MLVISADPKKKKVACRASYNASHENKRAASRASYRADPEEEGSFPGSLPCQWPTHRVFLYSKPTFDRAACSGLLVSPGS